MKKNDVRKDARLLEAIDHIDDKHIAETEKYYRDVPTRGMPQNKAKLTARSIKQVAALVACLLLLSAAIPIVSHLIGKIPDVTGPAGSGEATGDSEPPETVETTPPVELPEEYFTTGEIYSWSAATTGLEYNGYWIYAEKRGDIVHFVKYDPVKNVASNICLDSSCNHLSDACPLCSPTGWDVRFVDIFDDWLVTDFWGSSSDEEELSLYNMKTGESRVIFENSAEKHLNIYFVMDGIVYLNIYEYDQQGEKTKEYISSYDPATGEITYMFDEPENLALVGMTNKRFFFKAPRPSLMGPGEIWTTDYSGGNLKLEDVLNYDLLYLRGTYAYAINDLAEGNVMRVYDLETNSTFTIDLGVKTNGLLFDSDNFGYVTTSNTAEWYEFTKNRTAYVKKLYPDVTDKNEIEKLKEQLNIELLYRGEMKIHIGNERGENMELVFEGTNMYFTPHRIVGDYLMGEVEYASATEYKLLDTGGNAALNLKTGEITLIPLTD